MTKTKPITFELVVDTIAAGRRVLLDIGVQDALESIIKDALTDETILRLNPAEKRALVKARVMLTQQD